MKIKDLLPKKPISQRDILKLKVHWKWKCLCCFTSFYIFYIIKYLFGFTSFIRLFHWRKNITEYFMCRQAIHSNVLILWIYAKLVESAVHLAVFQLRTVEMWNDFQGVSKADDKNQDKMFSKIIPDPNKVSFKWNKKRKMNTSWQAGPW